MSRVTFPLHAVPPFRLDLTAWAIRRRPQNAMDVWNGEKYERVLAVHSKAVLVTVKQVGAADLEVTVAGERLSESVKRAVTAALERLLGLGIDLEPFYRLAAEHPRLNELALRFRGLKPPRFPTVWEGLVNGIACQQLSLNVGILLLNRLAALCGPAFQDRHAFPRPEDLAAADPDAVRSLGFSGAKVRALTDLGREIAAGQVDPESWEVLDDEEAIARLEELRGVGRWTAEYTLLRGMGRISLFPGDDIGARNNLARWMHLRKPLDYGRISRVVGKWKPYGGLIYFHLLLDGLERAGYVGNGGAGMIKVKRVYEERSPDDGQRYLVERLWPRGIKKAELHMDGWLKDVAPSTELREWFGHEPEKWTDFRRRYAAELDRKQESWAPLLEAARRGTVTLLYSSRDTEHNNALALEEYLERKLGAKTRTAGGRARH